MKNEKIIFIILIVFLFIGVGYLWGRSAKNDREYRDRSKELRTEINKYQIINKQLSEKNKQLADTITTITKQLAEYRKRIRKAETITIELSKDTGRISSELSKAIEQVRRIEKGIQEIKKELNINGGPAGDTINNSGG